MEYIIKTNDLKKNYRSFKALDGLSLNVPKGSIYGLVGRNGAGKTTFFRILCGLQEPSSGDYEIYGVKNNDRGIMKSRRRMGAVVETPSIYLDMSAQQNLKYQCRMLGLPDYSCVDELLKLVGLANTGKKKAKNFSLGMKQRLGIAIALVGEPDLLILDEPINGLDPQGIVEMRELILKLNREHEITVMISSHILEELAKLADSYGIIHEGKLIEQFTNDELMSRCGQFVAIKTPDNDGAIKALSGIGITQTSIDEDGVLRVGERLEDSDKMAAAIVKADVPLKELYVNSVSLEDYYLSLTGGEHNG